MRKNYFVKCVFSLVFTVLLTGSALAQTVNVTGIVKDASDGSSIPGVAIQVKGTTQGITTDMDGKYAISVERGSTLVFSFIGYKTQEVLVDKGEINVALEIEVEGIEEVVVIGYGIQKKSDATGAVTAIGSDEFNRGNITSPQELLVGRTAGVQINSNSGAPGEGSTIRIRGGSSLSANNDPLFIIDGVPVDIGTIDGMRNPLNVLNPNDIETFTVLKDASATAIYGNRASNGVIIITTKKGKLGRPLKLNYSGKLSMSTTPKFTDIYSADEFSKLVQEKVDEGYLPDTAMTLLGDANTNWQDEIYENSMGMEHNISATGAYKNLPYRFSVGYSNQDGILTGDNLERMTGSMALNPSFLDDHLNIDLNVKGMNMKNKFANRDAIGAAVSYDPTQPVRVGADSSQYGGYHTWLDNAGNPNTLAPNNPVALLNLKDDFSEANRMIGNLQLDYRCLFLPELRANLNLGYDHSKSEGTVFTPPYAAWSYDIDPDRDGGNDKIYSQEKKNKLLDFYLNYVKEVPKLKSRFDVMAGYSYQHFYETKSEYETNVYRDSTHMVIYNDDDDPTELYLISYFGRFNYSLLDRYLLTFTLRNDMTSRFSPDNRKGYFPAAAFAWKIKEESFLKDVDAISSLKLRLGWGITGQQAVGGNYLYLASYIDSENDAQYLIGEDTVTTSRPDRYDANIKWEETTTYNAGLDFGFANDRIIGSIDVYKRETIDLLNEISVPAGTNFSNRVFTNVGTLENRGFEIALTGRPISKPDMFWEVNVNFTYNKNEITKLTAIQDSTYIGVATGGISGGVGNNIQIHSVGHPASSFYVYQQVFDEDGNPIEGLYVDRNGDGVVDQDDMYRFQKPAPDMYFGFGTRFEYKNFDFMFNGRVSIGNYVYYNIASSNGVYSNMWDDTYFLRNLNSSYDYNFYSEQYFSDYYIENASYLRIDNISLGYTFREVGLSKLNMRVSATVQNALVYTKYSGLDPEVKDGIDNNIYPRPRIFVFGLNVDF